MASTEEKIKAVEDSIYGLRTQLDKFANDIETTRQDNMRVIEEKTMGIEQDSQAAHVKVNQLYEIANKTITILSDRVNSLEGENKDGNGQYGLPYGPKSLVPAKCMVPAKLSKVEDWKRWKSDLED